MSKRIVHITDLAEEDFINATAQMTKQQQMQHEIVAVAKVLDERPKSVITDPHDTYVKLLAYAGPPPRENLSRGVTVFSAYIPWVRQVSLGLRTLLPDRRVRQNNTIRRLVSATKE